MSKIRILVVEDELVIAQDLKNKLQSLGYKGISTVPTGEAAIEQAKTKPDLIFMDVILQGGMDGIETATKIKEIANIPIVYLSAYADDDVLERAEKTSPYGYILKPCGAQELQATIKIVLNKHQELAKLQNSRLNYSHLTSFNRLQRDRNQNNLAAIIKDLRQAIGKQEFKLQYQPKINLKTREIIGLEALIRWHHPTLGLIPPDIFILIAEQTNLIQEIGTWVIQEACQQMKTWLDRGASIQRVAVNLSACQLNQPNLSHLVVAILEQTGLAPQHLELELTESSLVRDPESTIRQLNFFKSLGIKISIDDFGKGYSSLSYLQIYPFDTLKIDSSFIHNIDQKAKRAAIVSSMIQMAHRINLDVIAEGVETEAELAFLTHNQCDAIQGYLFSPPLSPQQIEPLLITKAKLMIPKVV